VEKAGPWKARKTKSRFSSLPTALGNPAKTAGFPLFPQPRLLAISQTTSGNLIVVDRKECLTPDTFSRTYKGEEPFAARIMEFSGSLDDFRWDADKLAEEILLRADQTIERNEHRARFAWWISTVLFAIGWSLALIGRLYGVHEAGGGE